MRIERIAERYFLDHGGKLEEFNFQEFCRIVNGMAEFEFLHGDRNSELAKKAQDSGGWD